MVIKKIDKKNNFAAVFDTKTGFYMRTGILKKVDGEIIETDEDPFMTDFPELLDIGIMGTCVHGSSGLCIKSGIQCYQNGLGKKKPNMNITDFENIIKQCKNKVFQTALGGRGDPNKHEEFENILRICRENNIVPNYTTSGLALTDEEVYLTKKYCGAVAVSEYFSEYTRTAIKKFVEAGCKTNIHFVIGKQTIDKAIDKLKNKSFDEGINAVIFLLHKPVGLGERKFMLDPEDPRIREFFELIDSEVFPFKIGFDSCTVPALINFTKNLDARSFDTCEGGRWSAYIDSDMNMMPCSFLNDNPAFSVSLKEKTIYEAWHSEQFEAFRKSLSGSCIKCPNQKQCMGGCPIVRDIVLCNRAEKEQKKLAI